MKSRSAKSVLGYFPVNKKILEDSAENIKRWLNFHVLSATINHYPGDIVRDNGAQLFELVKYLTGKGIPGG